MDKFQEVKKIERLAGRSRNLRYRTRTGLDFFLQSIFASDPLCRRWMLEKHVDRTSIYRCGILRSLLSLSFPSSHPPLLPYLRHLAYVFLNSIGKENIDRALFYTHTHTHTLTRPFLSSFPFPRPCPSLSIDRSI